MNYFVICRYMGDTNWYCFETKEEAASRIAVLARCCIGIREDDFTIFECQDIKMIDMKELFDVN